LPYVAATVKSAQVVELTASEVEAYEASIGKGPAKAAAPPPPPVVEEVVEPEIGETIIEDFDPELEGVLGALEED